MLLCQLLQGLLQADALVPLVLQGLVPLLAVGLGQREEVSAGLWGTEQTRVPSPRPRRAPRPREAHPVADLTLGTRASLRCPGTASGTASSVTQPRATPEKRTENPECGCHGQYPLVMRATRAPAEQQTQTEVCGSHGAADRKGRESLGRRGRLLTHSRPHSSCRQRRDATPTAAESAPHQTRHRKRPWLLSQSLRERPPQKPMPI